MGRWLPNPKPNRIWHQLENNQIITDLFPLPKEPLMRINILKRQKNQIDEILMIESTDVHIMCMGTKTKQYMAIAWMVWDNNGVIQTQQLNNNNDTYSNAERANITALYDCLKWIIHRHEQWTTTPMNTIMTIHTRRQ
jgi:hypothetical protein